MQALIGATSSFLGLNLQDLVSDWYWDGAPEAQNVFSRMFPEAHGHTCLEHAKRNACKRAQGEWGKQLKLWVEGSEESKGERLQRDMGKHPEKSQTTPEKTP